MKKSVLIIMILAISTKIIGFSRDVLLSFFYGVSNISDAYLVSIIIPTLIVAFIGTGITTSFIPLYNRIKIERGYLSADLFTINVIKFILVICTILVIIVLLFTGSIVKLFASGFEGDVFNLTVNFTKISIVSVYFAALIYIFSGYLQIKNNFFAPAMMGIPNNLIIMLSIFSSVKFGLYVLAAGTVIAMFSQMIFLLFFVYKKGLRFNYKKEKNHEDLKKMIILSIPVILGVSVNQINVLIDRTMASQIVVGGISALNYADRLNEFIQAIFVMSIITVIYPQISKMAINGNIAGLKIMLLDAVSGISLLVIPATVGSMLLAEPIIRFLFGRGEFNQEAILMTSNVLFFYSLGMCWFGLREVISRVFFALQDTKTPMINATIAMVLNIILNVALGKYMGISGLALATSISAMGCTGLLLIQLRKRIGPFWSAGSTISILKIAFASLIMGGIILLGNNYLFNNLNDNIALLTTIIIGFISYLISIYYLKIEFVQQIFFKIRKAIKLRRRKKIA